MKHVPKKQDEDVDIEFSSDEDTDVRSMGNINKYHAVTKIKSKNLVDYNNEQTSHKLRNLNH